MDKQLIRTRFARSIRSYAEYAQAQTVIASRLCSLLSGVLTEEPHKVLEIGCGTGTFTRQFLKRFRPEEMALNDICPEVKGTLADLLTPQVHFTPGDAETCALPDDRDLIVSCSVLQWFEAPGAFITRCRTLMRGGGCLALTTFGPDNLHEVTAVTGTGLNYLTMNRLHDLLTEAGLRTVLTEEEHLTLHFPSPTEVLRHLKHTGVTGVTRTSWTKGRLAEFSAEYLSGYGAGDGSVPLTYHPIYLIAKK
ncbi:MAG TPA: malonyl-ACP O-methyltransferase BioC [Candidatus Coprenecus stercoravium]|uniref:Malonyl-[acyl-carrier protein] O-methyltransferase n=1 Tax=Candidatus Coprenecus stercoravium TaxID=2840735 RepID=A0A9D2GQV8_9BACT|nr:malonyl-ACP O-methyltransferase BioC [Candidatus Coprenecus stercoravium]